MLYKLLLHLQILLNIGYLFLKLHPNKQVNYYFHSKTIAHESQPILRQQRKPEWVAKEIIRLKALMIHDGCRKVADTFNRLYADKRQMTVGKTYVYYTTQKHLYEIKVLRWKIKNKRPRIFQKNQIWSMDLTQVTDARNNQHKVFGIVDSGTRVCLCLKNIPTKASILLLRVILDTIERHEKPKAIRTDNEAVFTSRLFRFGLWLLNIKHQRTEVCCPWMNGKIERFFGTLKNKLRFYTVASKDALASDLATYRFWYNHVRTHQHLNGQAPAEVWGKTKPDNRSKAIEFSAWDNALTGIYFLPP